VTTSDLDGADEVCARAENDKTKLRTSSRTRTIVLRKMRDAVQHTRGAESIGRIDDGWSAILFW